MQEGWYSRGTHELPEAITEDLKNRYKNSAVNPELLVDTLELITSSVTANRHYQELINLDYLGLSNDEAESYYDLTTIKSSIPKRIDWFSRNASKAFETLHAGNEKVRKITLELGGTRQYGQWVHDGERTSREVDDATWYLANDLRRNFPRAEMHNYPYEGATPTKYRAFTTPKSGEEPDFIVGRRRRAVLDITLDGLTIHVIKQFRGLIPLGALTVDGHPDKYREILAQEYDLREDVDMRNMTDDEKSQRAAKIERINRVTGTVMRTTILRKEDNLLSVCPVDVNLIMTAHRPE